MSTPLVSEPEIFVQGSQINGLLAFAEGKCLLDINLPVQKRLELAYAFAVKGRTQAAIREILNSLQLTSYSHKPRVLQQVALFLQQLDLNSQAIAACTIAIDQVNSNRHPNERLRSELEITLNKLKSNGPSTTCTLQTEQIKNGNENAVLETLEYTLHSQPMATKNPYAAWIAHLYRQMLKVEGVKINSFDTCLLDRQSMLDILVHNLTESIVTLPMYRDFIDSEEMEENLDMMKLSLMKTSKEALLCRSSKQFVKYLNECFRDRSGSAIVSSVTFNQQKQFLEAIRCIYRGNTDLAGIKFESLVDNASMILRLKYKKAARYGIDEYCLLKLKEASLRMCASSCILCLVCILGQLEWSDLYSQIEEQMSKLAKLANGLQLVLHKDPKLAATINRREITVAQGRILELFSFVKAKPLQYIDQAVYKLDDNLLMKMITYYKKALESTSKDDPLRSRLCMKILWGVMMKGGANIEVSWVVKYMADLAQLDSDCSLISGDDSNDLGADFFYLEKGIDANFCRVLSKLYRQRRYVATSKDVVDKIRTHDKYSIPELMLREDGTTFSCEKYIDTTGYIKGTTLSYRRKHGILRNRSLTTANRNAGFSQDLEAKVLNHIPNAFDRNAMLRFVNKYYS